MLPGMTGLARAILLLCPNCGKGRVMASWSRIRAGCPACGLRLERDEENEYRTLLAVQILVADERLLRPVRLLAPPLQSREVLAVHVDLDRVARGGVVHAVHLVAGDQARHAAGRVARDAQRLELRAARPRLRHAIARLLDLVLDHADDTPRLVVVRRGAIAGPPHHRRDVEPRRAVQDVASAPALGRFQ